MRSAHDRCACAVRRADHDGGRDDLAHGGGLARDRKMDSRNCAARLTITQAEKSTARTNVCGTRVSGDPGAASFPGPPSAANRCLTSISLGKMAPNAARRCAVHGVRRAPPCGRYPPTAVRPACGRRPRSRPLGSAGRRCRPNFFRTAGGAAPRIARGCTTRREALRRARSAARVGTDNGKAGPAHTRRLLSARMRTAAYASSDANRHAWAQRAGGWHAARAHAARWRIARWRAERGHAVRGRAAR